MKNNYDVIVVGAGPAGCIAARDAARAGLDVLLLEKRAEIGAPVRCAEAIGVKTTEEVTPINPRWVDASIEKFSVHNRLGDFAAVPPGEPTVVVNRKLFDLDLSFEAARAGAIVITKTAATGVLRDEHGVCGVNVLAHNQATRVSCRLLIAADGNESQIARWAGLKTTPRLQDYYIGIEYLVSINPDEIAATRCEYHLDQALMPGGYGWVFPKGEASANIGLVMSAAKTGAILPLERLDAFVNKRFSHYSTHDVMGGGIAVTGGIARKVANGLMVIGDAAHNADPLHAGGINLGMLAGQMAMQTAIPALMDGDVSEKRLAQYEERWKKRFHKTHHALFAVRQMLDKMDDEARNALVKTAATLPLETMSTTQILLAVLKKHPRLLFEARTLIANGLLG